MKEGNERKKENEKRLIEDGARETGNTGIETAEECRQDQRAWCQMEHTERADSVSTRVVIRAGRWRGPSWTVFLIKLVFGFNCYETVLKCLHQAFFSLST